MFASSVAFGPHVTFSVFFSCHLKFLFHEGVNICCNRSRPTNPSLRWTREVQISTCFVHQVQFVRVPFQIKTYFPWLCLFFNDALKLIILSGIAPNYLFCYTFEQTCSIFSLSDTFHWFRQEFTVSFNVFVYLFLRNSLKYTQAYEVPGNVHFLFLKKKKNLS